MSNEINQAEQAENSSAGKFAVICAQNIYPNSSFNVVVSVHNMEEECNLELSLSGENFEEIKELLVKPTTTMEQLKFEIPDIADGEYKLKAKGTKGLSFEDTVDLSYQRLDPSVYVQTDKATYKPGDLVRFRVIFLDENTRPAKLRQPVVVFIQDAEQNRIKEFNDVDAPKGVFSGELQLSEFPVMGKWSLEVQMEGKGMMCKFFDVDKYVLPKFEVKLNAPKKVYFADETIGFNVEAKYTFGKSVQGKATLTVKRSTEHDFQCFAPPSCCIVDQTKSVDFNGKAYVEFALKDIVPNGVQFATALKVSATVEEELTGNIQEATAETSLVRDRFNIIAPHVVLDAEEAEKPFKYKVTITNVNDEPVSDTEYPVKFSPFGDASTFPTVEVQLSGRGTASIELNCAEHDHLNIQVEYRGQQTNGYVSKKSPFTTFATPTEELQVKAESLSSGKPLEISFTTVAPIDSFAYVVVARGKIICNELISLESPTKNVLFHIETCFEMMPQASVLVYYIKGGHLTCKESKINLNKEFENSISIEAPEQTEPGALVDLQVKTTLDSYVGLMALDQSVLLLKSGNDFDGDEILGNLHTGTFGFGCMWPSRGNKSGVLIITNARGLTPPPIMNLMCKSRAVGGALFGAPQASMAFASPDIDMGYSLENFAALPSEPEPPRVRTQFLESWFFEDIESTAEETTQVVKQIPDTITSWIVSGFSMNSSTGFALTTNPTKIQTFRPFFITTNLPYAIKRGETVNIPIIIFNYTETPMDTQVTLQNTDDEFEFVDADVSANEDELSEKGSRVKRVTAASNNGEVVMFAIRAKQIGNISLRVTATSAFAGDAIDKKLRVEPEGITVYKNHDLYLQPSENGTNFQHKKLLDIPEDIVPDSELIEVSIMGDILSSTLCNLDKLVRMPYGCGEQNMVNFVPNILVLRYLKSMQQNMPKIETEAKRFMEVGYQRELTYKHSDGSYSAFGPADKSGSTWLTAYVMRSFQQAADYIKIDANVVDAGLRFLAKKQLSNGGFREDGKLFDFAHCNELALTAFVLLAFLENDARIVEYADIIDRGIKFLEERTQQTDDLYGCAIALYALQLRQSSVVEKVLPTLQARAVVKSGHQWWTNTKEIEQHSQQCPWRPRSNDVELTSYILMTLLESEASIMPIASWLVAQRNSNGGFEATQDTVVGLQALIQFAKKMRVGDTSLTIDVSDAERKVDTMQVSRENAMVMQTLQLPKHTREVNFDVNGTGVVILQVAYRYNELECRDKQSFNLSTEVKSPPEGGKLALDVYVEFVPPLTDEGDGTSIGREESNMVVVEVTLPSGYSSSEDDCEPLKAVEDVKRVEMQKDGTQIIVYFDSLKRGVVKCLSISADRTHEVNDQKPAPVVVYDYYDSQQRCLEFYQI